MYLHIIIVFKLLLFQLEIWGNFRLNSLHVSSYLFFIIEPKRSYQFFFVLFISVRSVLVEKKYTTIYLFNKAKHTSMNQI